MKCPKCGYLGFDTGDRCKNCGYDFSLTTDAFPQATYQAPDITLIAENSTLEEMEVWLRDEPSEPVAPKAEPIVSVPVPVCVSAPVSARAAVALPLFMGEDGDDDAPLVTLPVKPRPPLAVRRTPQTPRLRAVPRPQPVEPVLDFQDEGSIESAREEPLTAAVAKEPAMAVGTDRIASQRIAAAALDHAILIGVDVVVAYFTLRMAGLTLAELRLLPPVPFLIFLGMMKFAYFAAFTAVGGQTVGKMAMGIRVVRADNGCVNGAGAIRRTLAAVLSHITLGLAYLPALLGPDRRALHDRIARTRVVALPSA